MFADCCRTQGQAATTGRSGHLNCILVELFLSHTVAISGRDQRAIDDVPDDEVYQGERRQTNNNNNDMMMVRQ